MRRTRLHTLRPQPTFTSNTPGYAHTPFTHHRPGHGHASINVARPSIPNVQKLCHFHEARDLTFFYCTPRNAFQGELVFGGGSTALTSADKEPGAPAAKFLAAKASEAPEGGWSTEPAPAPAAAIPAPAPAPAAATPLQEPGDPSSQLVDMDSERSTKKVPAGLNRRPKPFRFLSTFKWEGGRGAVAISCFEHNAHTPGPRRAKPCQEHTKQAPV